MFSGCIRNSFLRRAAKSRRPYSKEKIIEAQASITVHPDQAANEGSVSKQNVEIDNAIRKNIIYPIYQPTLVS